MVRSMSILYDGSKACVKLEGREEYSEIKRGLLRQGCVMSPWLFSIFFDRVVTENNGEGVTLKDENGVGRGNHTSIVCR